MKEYAKNKILKTITILAIITTILFSYVPMFVFAEDTEDEANTSTNNYVQLKADWQNSEELLVGETSTNYAINYNLKLTGVQTGFKDVVMKISNAEFETPIAKITSNSNTSAVSVENYASYSIIDFGNKNTGQEIYGSVNIIFDDDGSEYSKKILVTLTGTYTDPTTKEETQINKEIELNAEITPKTQVVNFIPYLNMETQKGVSTNPSISKNKITAEYGYYSTQVTAVYPIKLKATSYTQKLELKVTINRKYAEESKTSDGYTINWDGLDTVLGTPVKNVNEDGSITYVFTKGEDSENYDANNVFSINDHYNIKIIYKVPNTTNNTPEQSNSTLYFTAEMETIGWKTEKEYNKDLMATKQTEIFGINKNSSVALALYTPGQHTWVDMDWTSGKPFLEESDMNELIENREKDFYFYANTNYVYGSQNNQYNGSFEHYVPILSYLSDSGKVINKTLTSDEIRLKQIAGKGNLQLITENSTVNLVDNNGTYTVPIGTNINKFSVKFNDFCNNYYSGYNVIYTLYADKLGLSDTEIANIISLEIGTNASGTFFYGGEVSGYYNSNSEGNQFSYMELDISDNFNTSMDMLNKPDGPQTITLTMYKDEDLLNSEQSVVNVNPVFFVQMPSDFKYSNINVEMTKNSYISINTEDLSRTKVNGETYLVIPCEGTYDSRKLEKVQITILYTRTLSKSSASSTQKINAYMLTDNERYIYEKSNVNEFEKGENIPSKIFATSASFEITKSTVITVTTGILNEEDELVETNPVNEISDPGEKELPLPIESNKQVKYRSKLEVEGTSVTNVTIVSRLPIANNVNIENTNEKILSDDYVLPDEYVDNTELKDITKGSAVNQISLINLENITVYKDNKVVSNSNYTIYYSTDGTASFDLDSYVEYEDGVSDLTEAKTLLVKFSDDFKIASGEQISIRYEMTMPDEGGMVGATTAVQYTKANEEESTTLSSSAIYVINAKPVGNLTLQKKFEGYDIGEAPTDVSLSGIEFKLIDENGDFVKDSLGNDVVATTDDQGIAKFTGILYGEYTVYEVTQFDDYSGIGNLVIANIEIGKNVTMTVENKYKLGTLVVEKIWQNTNEQQGKVTFTIKRDNGDNLNYIATSTTDEEGKATFLNVPYGKYIVTETVGKNGWTSTGAKTVELHEETATVQMENRLSYTTLQIVKYVPEGETVDELTFRITGTGMVNYIDKDGNTVLNNTDIEVTVGEDYSANPNITIEKLENDTVVTITITELPLGSYEINEVDIPIDGTNITKYPSVSEQVNLNEDIGVSNSPVVVSITNNYKYGYLQINKTAKLKEGDNYTEIGYLSSFKVRITGTSYYGTEVDETITLDEDGYGKVKIEIGEYTITEVAVDGYTTYYGTDSTASTTPAKVTVQYNKTVTQNIYNEHTGVGYVRVEKTLEGYDDPQKVLDAGIEFKVVGQNIAGGRVEEFIKIDKIDTTKNVAYGVSGPISSGGEYELQEVESTVPEFFEGIEPVEIDLTTNNTSENPLVIEAVNARTKGNLEIVTQTYPTGGPLIGITYKVTEVEINKNGSYTKVGESLDVEGSNDAQNRSFAILEEINAGYYLVEQVTVPDGWEKDLPQIVEVPSYSTGYVVFEINKSAELEKTKVIVTKEIYVENAEYSEEGTEEKYILATQDDFENAQLNSEQNFEVKITNVQTNEVYYTFIGGKESGIIEGLTAGEYIIEEVYKPKYTNIGYFIGPAISRTEIESQDGIYKFTIQEPQNNEEQVVQIVIKNKINTDFGFGGQTSKDNFSKINYEKTQLYTKAIIYVVDENNDAISGVKFKLVNENGQIAIFNGNTEFEISERKVILKGLDVGKYTLVCTEYPDGYLKPEDKEIIVYSDAVQVTRVEIQADIPRGVMLLSTVYTTDNNKTKYVSRSKYKVVDTETGELVKFIKTASGNYITSNLPTASDEIVLKAGIVTINNLPVGTYEIGLTDVTSGYGLTSDEVKVVEVIEGQDNNVVTKVRKAEIVGFDIAGNTTLYLDANGDLWFTGKFISGDTNAYYPNPIKIDVGNGTKFSTFASDYDYAVLVDTEGKVWTGRITQNTITKFPAYYGQGTTINAEPGKFTCITNIEGTDLYNAYLENTKIVSVATARQQVIALDNTGKVWTWGYNENGQLGNGESSETPISTPICISNIEGNTLNGAKISKLANINDYNNGVNNIAVIDEQGKVWTWGNNKYGQLGNGEASETPVSTPICISDIENSIIKDKQIIQVSISGSSMMLLDNNGKLYTCGNNFNKTLEEFDMSKFNNEKLVYIYNANSAKYYLAIDEQGKVWTWGNNGTGQLGNGTTNTENNPICISDEEIEKLYGIKASKIEAHYAGPYYVIMQDKNGHLWTWGWNSLYGENGTYKNSYKLEPERLTYTYSKYFEYNLSFTKVETGPSSLVLLDKNGKVWVAGYNGEIARVGTGDRSSSDVYLTRLILPEDVKIVDFDRVSFGYVTALLDNLGNVWTFGVENSSGELGIGNNKSNYGINKIDFKGNKIVKVSMGKSFGVALDENGHVWTWGNNSSGQLGNGTTENENSPKEIDSYTYFNGNVIVDITAGYDYVVALDNTGKVWTWGSNANKALGIEGNSSYTPICISNNENNPLANVKIEQISCCDQGQGNVIALDSQGKVWVWAANSYGDGNITLSSTPVCISELEGNWLKAKYDNDENYKIIEVRADYYGFYVKDINGDMWAWNSNSNWSYFSNLTTINDSTKYAVCINENVKINYIDTYHENMIIIDEKGELWTYGKMGQYISLTEEFVNTYENGLGSILVDYLFTSRWSIIKQIY